MKKKIFAIALAACMAVMVFALAGCSSEEESSSSEASSSESSSSEASSSESSSSESSSSEASSSESSSSEESSSSSSSTSSSSELRFVTGGESGTYYAYGTVLAQYATNNAGLQVNALSSEGSKANIQSLEDGDAELAFCQTDVATYAYEGTGLFEEDGAVTDFSVVAALYQEQVQIVTCDESITSVSDLEGKTVSIGAANSGVYFNALDILAAYGLSENDIDPVYQDFADSTDSLQNGKIDAAFIVAGAPTTAISDLSASKQAYLISLDSEHVESLMETSPYYAKATIDADTYSGQTEACETVAVLAVILASNSVSEDDVYDFTASLFEGAEKQPDAHAKYEELNLDTAASITSVPYNEGAIKYYEEQGVSVKTA